MLTAMSVSYGKNEFFFCEKRSSDFYLSDLVQIRLILLKGWLEKPSSGLPANF